MSADAIPLIDRRRDIMVKVITEQNFEEEVLKSEKPVLVDFWATWCGPCRRQAPIVEALAEEGYTVGKVDVDQEMGLAQEYKVMSIPTLIVFKNGKEANRLVGLTPKETLEGLLAEEGILYEDFACGVQRQIHSFESCSVQFKGLCGNVRRAYCFERIYYQSIKG